MNNNEIYQEILKLLEKKYGKTQLDQSLKIQQNGGSFESEFKTINKTQSNIKTTANLSFNRIRKNIHIN